MTKQRHRRGSRRLTFRPLFARPQLKDAADALLSQDAPPPLADRLAFSGSSRKRIAFIVSHTDTPGVLKIVPFQSPDGKAA